MELDRRFLGWSVNLKKFRNIVGSLAINCFVDNAHQLEDDSLRDREPVKLFQNGGDRKGFSIALQLCLCCICFLTFVFDLLTVT